MKAKEIKGGFHSAFPLTKNAKYVASGISQEGKNYVLTVFEVVSYNPEDRDESEISPKWQIMGSEGDFTFDWSLYNSGIWRETKEYSFMAAVAYVIDLWNDPRIRTNCPFCKRRGKGSTNFVTVDPDGYWDWLNSGGALQEFLPGNTPNEREMLMTGMCSTCFDILEETEV